MYEIHKMFFAYMKQKNMQFTYYFIMFTVLDNQEYILDADNHMLYINGTESFIPGILDKTIQAFDIIHNKIKIPYDFIFRTNISTFVHFKNTYEYLKQFVYNPTRKMIYIGPLITLSWIDDVCGIVDNRYWGVKYCSGTCMILNSVLINNIIQNRDKIVHTLIDDVAIGHYISQLRNVHIVDISPDRYSGNPHNLLLNTKHLAYMNNFNKENREVDIHNLKKIVNWYYIHYILH